MGPVMAQPMITTTANMNANGLPVAFVTFCENFSKKCFMDFFIYLFYEFVDVNINAEI